MLATDKVNTGQLNCGRERNSTYLRGVHSRVQRWGKRCITSLPTQNKLLVQSPRSKRWPKFESQSDVFTFELTPFTGILRAILTQTNCFQYLIF